MFAYAFNMSSPQKTVPATTVRRRLYATVKQVGRGKPVTITHRGNPPVVLMAADQLSQLLTERDLLREIAAGIGDIASGKIVAHRQVVQRLRTLQKSWK